MNNTVCPRSSDPLYIVSYYTKRVTASWTYSTVIDRRSVQHNVVSSISSSCLFTERDLTKKNILSAPLYGMVLELIFRVDILIYWVDRILPQICTASASANMKHALTQVQYRFAPIYGKPSRIFFDTKGIVHILTPSSSCELRILIGQN